MRWRIFFASVMLFLLPDILLGADPIPADSSGKKIHMTFYDMNFGMDWHHATYLNNSIPGISNLNYAMGISGRIQSSFAAYFNRNKKFLIGDILSAELGAGG
ncbi:MAG: hypothetical protein ACHQK8_01215, partial [Bacteroidia bacterium]